MFSAILRLFHIPIVDNLIVEKCGSSNEVYANDFPSVHITQSELKTTPLAKLCFSDVSNRNLLFKFFTMVSHIG